MSGVPDDGVHDAEVESRWEAAPAVLVIIALQCLLAVISYRQGWTLWHLPWWAWFVIVVPEVILLVPLAWSRPRHQLEEIGKRRTFALLLFGVISVGNGVALIALIGSLLMGHEDNGAELIYKGITIWTGEHDRVRALVLDVRSGRPRPPPRAEPAAARLPVPADGESRRSPRRAGTRGCSTTSTSRTRTRSRSARPTRCR